jgi:hypothetical protein
MKGGKDYTFSKKRNGIPTAVLTVMSYDGVWQWREGMHIYVIWTRIKVKNISLLAKLS